MRIPSSLYLCVFSVLMLAACGGGDDSGGGGSGGGGGPAGITITTASLPGAILNDLYGEFIATANGSGSGYTWSVVSGALPTGLSLNQGSPDANISGTATAAGTFNFTLEVQDPAGGSDTQSFSITVTAQVFIVTTALNQGAVSTPYSEAVVTSGGSGSGYTWTITAGALPTGLNLVQGSPDATISGTPTAVGNSNFTLQVDDPTGGSYSRSFSISIYASPPVPLNIGTLSLPNGDVGTAYSQTVVAGGGATPYSWSVLSGTLPPGTTLTSATPNATVSGNPTTAGTYNFTLQVADSGTQTVTRAFTVHIFNGALTITTTTVPNGQTTVAYSQAISAVGGTESGYSWSVVSGSLPTGYSLTSGTPDATLAGTTSTAGGYTFTVEVTDSFGNTDTQAITLTVTTFTALSITTSALVDGVENNAYFSWVSATGGTYSSYSWSVISGALPTGVTLSTGGTPDANLSGNPSVNGTFNFTVRVQDSGSNSATMPLTLVVNPPLSITTTSVAAGQLNTSYSEMVTATGGTTTGYTWSVSAGALPGGISLTSGTPSATLSGTPGQTGTFNFTLQVLDSASNQATQAFSLTVYDTLTITTTAMAAGTENVAYSEIVTATGGSASGYTWSVITGGLPTGLGIINGTPSCTIDGTPTVPTTWGFTIQVQDSLGFTAYQYLNITINPAQLSITSPATLPYAVDTYEYHYLLAANGGSGSYSWTFISGTLPTGIAFETVAGQAAVNGTPAQLGTFNFTIEAYDGSTSVQKAFSLVVRDASTTLNITTVMIGKWLINDTVDEPLGSCGGSGNGYTWAVASGSNLPAGVTITNGATPALTGMPSTSGIHTFTLEVTDSAATTESREFTVEVLSQAPDFYGQVVTDLSVFLLGSETSMTGSSLANLRAQTLSVLLDMPSAWSVDLISYNGGLPVAQSYSSACFGTLTAMSPARRWEAIKWVYSTVMESYFGNAVYLALRHVMQTYPTTLRSLFLTNKSSPAFGGSASQVLADSPSWFASFTSLTLHCFCFVSTGTPAGFMQQLAALHSGTYTAV